MVVAALGTRLRTIADRVLKPPQEITRHTFKRLSLRSLFLYLGPSLIVSMAYMDPGNYGTDIQSGQYFAYDLLWAVWLANLMAMVLQYLSGKLGIATGKGLPELVKASLRSRKFTVPYWLAAESAAAATDLAEYLGTVIALNILFQIPLLYAAILGALDVIILLALTKERFRIVEYFFMVMVSIIGIGFLYQVLLIQPSLSSIGYHSVVVAVIYPQYNTAENVDVGKYVAILQPLYGYLAGAAFAVTLLASGLASSTTGTLAGQAIMDGLLGTHVNKTLRRVVTRVVNVFPTTIAILIGLSPFTLLVYSQVILSLMIPLPMIPLVIYTRNKGLMGEFVNRRITTLFSLLSAALIITLNIYLITTVL